MHKAVAQAIKSKPYICKVLSFYVTVKLCQGSGHPASQRWDPPRTRDIKIRDGFMAARRAPPAGVRARRTAS